MTKQKSAIRLKPTGFWSLSFSLTPSSSIIAYPKSLKSYGLLDLINYLKKKKTPKSKTHVQHVSIECII